MRYFVSLNFRADWVARLCRYQLEHLTDGIDIYADIDPSKDIDAVYHEMANCVGQHNYALQYSTLMENANYISNFFQLGINMVCISFAGFQTVMHIETPDIAVRYTAFTLTQLFLLFLISYPGQMLYDHSIQVSEYVHNCGWYQTSLKTRKLVCLMTMRSRVPCQLTAGKFYVLNLMNFSAVKKSCDRVLQYLGEARKCRDAMNYSTEVSHHGPNKLLLSAIGLWPHQATMEKRFFFIVTIFLVVTQGYFQIGGLITAWCNTDIFLESIPPVTIDLVCYIKLLNWMYNGDKMKKLLETIENDWKLYGVGDELRILREFGNDCRKKTLMYAGAVYGSMVPFMLGPLIPIVVDLFRVEDTATANETMTRQLMFHVEYLVNVEEWYYWLLIHEYFATTAYITIVVGTDTMFLAYVQHACTLFSILGHRLENLVESDDLEIDLHPPMSEDKPYGKVIKCITLHSLALDYVDAIESAYSTSMFFQVGINVLCLSFTAFQAVMKLDYPKESVRYASFMLAQAFPVFYTSYPSECLLTESGRILQSFTKSSWYLTSIRTRKLVNLMVLRSMKPSCLTAAHLYVLDMEFFGTVVRTSVQYLTMLCSFR